MYNDLNKDSMDKKKQIEQLYTDALYNDEVPNVFADRILSLFGVSNSVICCPQCGNERLESTGGDWYICGDRSCDWGDKL